tara:strand:+ start:275 stop:1252 length:978 start_codon:yes stop_codon:yes gene_type:complete
MKISVNDLRLMIKEAINEQVLKEGPYLDKIKAQADKYRSASDDILSQMRAIKPQGSAPETTATPTTSPTDPAPGSDEDTQVDSSPLDNEDTQVNIDPEDMLQPDDPPAPSNDASFDTLLDMFNANYTSTLEVIGTLLPLAGIGQASDPKFIKLMTELGQYLLKKSNIDLEGDLNDELNDWAQVFGWTSEILRDRWGGYYDFDKSREFKLEDIQDYIGKIDPKTGFSTGLYRLILSLTSGSRSGGARTQGYTGNVELKKVYPALLRLTNSIGGSSASEKLKDILTTLDVMAPEDVGREREGALSSFWNDAIKGRRYKERDAMLDAV